MSGKDETQELASQDPQSPPDKQKADWKTIFGLITGIIGITGFFLSTNRNWIPEKISQLLGVIGLAVLIVTLVYRGMNFFRKINHWLSKLVPVLVLFLVLIQVAAILIYIIYSNSSISPDNSTTNKNIAAQANENSSLVANKNNSAASEDFIVDFDITRGAIYNSWQDAPSLNHYINAHGNMASGDRENRVWGEEKVPKAFYFHYELNPGVRQNDQDASSGGYMTFYANPCDIDHYEKLKFDCKVANAIGSPDVGIRLVVDDMNIGANQERVIYQIPSLIEHAKINRLDDQWQTFIIDVVHFKLKRFNPPLRSEKLTMTTINKIVFFVNNEIINKSEHGTLWFRKVLFKRN